MNSQDLRTLQLLEEIGNAELPSQRELAGKLGVSLGLVNSFVRRLAKKGYFKIRTIPRNRVKYILTSKGAAEKTRLTYEYVQRSYRFYRGTREKLQELFDRLVQTGVRRIVFYGVSDLAEIAFVSLQETPMRLVAVVDGQKVGERFLGSHVEGPDVLGNLPFDMILITTDGSPEKVLGQISARGISRERVAFLE